MNNISIKNNENQSICGKCNGACCRWQACHTHPTDIFGESEPTIEKLIEFLSQGNYQVDWWEGDVCDDTYEDADIADYRYRSYFIRPAHTNSISYLFDGAWNGTCIFFESGKGCKLSFEERPLGGKALVPSEDGKCKTSFSKKDACLAWYPFNNLFDQIRNEYSYEKVEDKWVFTKDSQVS